MNHRLNKFFIISISIHLLGALAAAAYLHNKEVITDPRPIVIDYFRIPSSDKKTAETPEGKKVSAPKKIIDKKQSEKPARKKLVVKRKSPLKKKEVEKIESTYVKETEKKPVDKIVKKEVNTFNSLIENIPEVPVRSEIKADRGSDKGVVLAYPNYKVNPKPDYPMIARRRGYEGEVLVKVWVLKNGRVGDLELKKPSGYNILDDSALDTVKDWQFIPGTRNGKAMSSWVTIPITFRLKNS